MQILLDSNLLQSPNESLTYWEPQHYYALKIFPVEQKFGLSIWKRGWGGIYSPRFRFSLPEAAALYAFDFLGERDQHRQIADACRKAKIIRAAHRIFNG